MPFHNDAPEIALSSQPEKQQNDVGGLQHIGLDREERNQGQREEQKHYQLEEYNLLWQDGKAKVSTAAATAQR